MDPSVERMKVLSIPVVFCSYHLQPQPTDPPLSETWTASVHNEVFLATGFKPGATMRVWDRRVIPGDPPTVRVLLADDDTYLELRGSDVAVDILDNPLDVLLEVAFQHEGHITLNDFAEKMIGSKGQGCGSKARLLTILGIPTKSCDR